MTCGTPKELIDRKAQSASFWSGKKESLLQSIVEITYKAVLTGLVVVFFAQFLIAMIDSQIEVASKRDALNTFRNNQLSGLTERFSEGYISLECTRSVRDITGSDCQSKLSTFLTELNAIFLELKVHYPKEGFESLLALQTLGEAIRADPSQVGQNDIDDFAVTFGASLDEMAQNFR